MAEHRNYANYDLEEEHADYVLMAVFASLLEDMSHSNFRIGWEIDATIGIQFIGWQASNLLPSYPYEYDLVTNRLNKPNGDPEHDRMAELAAGYMHAVYLAVNRLIEDGCLEVDTSWGWPCLRLTRVGLNYYGLPLPEHIQRLSDRVDQLRKMPYRDYLQSEEWRFRRDRHCEVAGERCQLCNSDSKPLHVHHRTYENRGRENFYDLVALCAHCHEMFHASGRKVR